MVRDSDSKALKLERGVICARMKDVSTSMIWNDKHDVCIPTDAHKPLAEGNFCGEHGGAHKTANVEDYIQQMDFIKKGGRRIC
jgi:hypothetical protein